MNDDISKFEDMLHAVNKLSEKDAKAFLKLIYGRFNIYETGNGTYSKDQLIRDILSTFQQIPVAVEIRKDDK